MRCAYRCEVFEDGAKRNAGPAFLWPLRRWNRGARTPILDCFLTDGLPRMSNFIVPKAMGISAVVGALPWSQRVAIRAGRQREIERRKRLRQTLIVRNPTA